MRIAGSESLIDLLPQFEVMPLTYTPIGATAGSLPPGFSHLDRQVRIGNTEAAFDRAAAGLLGWQMHRGAGLRVAARGPAEPGRTVVLGLGIGLCLAVPCRVLTVTEEPAQVGFAYGTLAGHPESGEESFHVTRRPDGSVHFLIRAYSRPGNRLVRCAGPLGRFAQRFATQRYIDAITDIAAGR